MVMVPSVRLLLSAWLRFLQNEQLRRCDLSQVVVAEWRVIMAGCSERLNECRGNGTRQGSSAGSQTLLKYGDTSAVMAARSHYNPLLHPCPHRCLQIISHTMNRSLVEY